MKIYKIGEDVEPDKTVKIHYPKREDIKADCIAGGNIFIDGVQQCGTWSLSQMVRIL